MLGAEDHRWSTLKSGYRLPLDPRPLVQKLINQRDTAAAWDELWSELHHQGDVGDASYAAVPLLVQVHKSRGVADWNTYALVSTIEIARTADGNPTLPDWLRNDYFSAIQELYKLGVQEIANTKDPESVRAILSVIALAKGVRGHAKFLIEYSEEELQEIEAKMSE